jgi:HAD superfamily hydrolase (TIGR01549 family)
MTMRAIVFDMDGTLLRLDVDIEEVRLRLAALYAQHGVTRPFRPILRGIRDGAVEAAARGADPAALERAGLAILDEWEVKGARSARARAGAADAISALRTRGVPLAIVTDNGRACVPVALEAAGIDAAAFSAVVTRDDVPAPKPDPAGLLRAADAVGTPLWYVGDHVKDMEAGRAAAAVRPGIRIAALRGGMSADEDLRRAGAERLLASLTETSMLG